MPTIARADKFSRSSKSTTTDGSLAGWTIAHRAAMIRPNEVKWCHFGMEVAVQRCSKREDEATARRDQKDRKTIHLCTRLLRHWCCGPWTTCRDSMRSASPRQGPSLNDSIPNLTPIFQPNDQSLQDSFSAVSAPIFAGEYSVCSVFRDLHDLQTLHP